MVMLISQDYIAYMFAFSQIMRKDMTLHKKITCTESSQHSPTYTPSNKNSLLSQSTTKVHSYSDAALG